MAEERCVHSYRGGTCPCLSRALAAEQRLAELRDSFDVQRQNYLRLTEAVYGGRMPSFEYDPFADAKRNHDDTRTVEAMHESVADAARLLSRCLPHVVTAAVEWRGDGDHEMANAIDKFIADISEFIDEHSKEAP